MTNNWNKREDLKMAEYAKSKGWTIEFHEQDILYGRFDPPHFGLSFRRDNIHVCAVRDGWRVADIINGYYSNHRTYQSLKEALDEKED